MLMHSEKSGPQNWQFRCDASPRSSIRTEYGGRISIASKARLSRGNTWPGSQPTRSSQIFTYLKLSVRWGLNVARESEGRTFPNLHENTLRCSRNAIKRRRSALPNRSQTLDTRRDHPRVQYGFHRWHGCQRRSAGDANQLSRDRGGHAMGSGVVRAVPERPDFGRRLAGGYVWPPSDLPGGCRSFRRGIFGLRNCGKPTPTNHRPKYSGGGGGA